MSTKSPAVSSRSSTALGPRPLSIRCVSPAARGGRPRSKGVSDALKDPLQSLVSLGLDVVVDRVAVRVDADRERAEVLDPEAPEALRHQLLPGHLLDLLDLRGLEGRRSSDDREVDHPESLHRLDCLVRQPTLAADRAHPVLRTQRLREAHHACRGGGADADRLVTALADLAYPGRRVEQKGPVQIPRRRNALVEDPDLGAVADADDVAVHDHLVARSELADLGFGGRESEAVTRHHASSPYPNVPQCLALVLEHERKIPSTRHGRVPDTGTAPIR